MSLLVHPHPMQVARPEPLRLLERRAARQPVVRAAMRPAPAARMRGPGVAAWIDRQLERLAAWAEHRAPAHRMGSWMLQR